MRPLYLVKNGNASIVLEARIVLYQSIKSFNYMRSSSPERSSNQQQNHQTITNIFSLPAENFLRHSKHPNSNPKANILTKSQMFFHNKSIIHEPESSPHQTTTWVNILLDERDRTCDDVAIMHTVVTCIRTKVFSITGHAMHHDNPLCISIRVPGDHHDKDSILAAAELSAEYLRSHVASGSVRVNRALLFRR